MKEFFIRLGAAIFYTIILLLILGGGSVNGYKIKGIIKLLIDMFNKNEIIELLHKIRNNQLKREVKENEKVESDSIL